MTTELAARLQFAVAAITHGVFSATTVGLITVIAVIQTLAYRHRDAQLGALARRWAGPYVVIYAFGIVAGMILEVEFGLGWNGLIDRAGNVVGTPLTIETLSTFVVESTLLALWTFGWGVLGSRLHLAVAWGLVATATLSEFWALVANSFLQHPQGYAIHAGTIVLIDFGALFTGWTLWGALVHIAGASCLIGGTLIAAAGAVRLRRPGIATSPEVPGTGSDIAAVKLGVRVAALGGVATMITGFQSFGYLRQTQPEKAVSIVADSSVRQAVATALSRRYGPGEWLPPARLVAPTMGMILIGGLVVLVAVWTALSGRPERPLSQAPVLGFLPAAFGGSLVALVCGWLVREVGRAPWVVHGLLSTSDAVSGTGTLRITLTLGVVVLLSLGTLAATVLLVRRMLRATSARNPASQTAALRAGRS